MPKFKYFHGDETEQFYFFRVPRALIRDEQFRGISTEAKLLYGLMLDRMGLSLRSGWLDENRTFLVDRYIIAMLSPAQKHGNRWKQ